MNSQFHPRPPTPVPFSGSKPKRTFSRTQAACENPHANGLINAVYLNAIEICGNLGSVKGLGVLFGSMALAAVVAMVIAMKMVLTPDMTHPNPNMHVIQVEDAIFAFFILLVALLAAVGAAIFLRRDIFTYRDEPILFNRRTRKVHFFRRRINMMRPFSPWPVVVDTYDWECMRGEINGGGVLIGSVPMLRYWLYLAVNDKPDSKRVIDRFVVGIAFREQYLLAALWEHIRRYMEEDGAPLQHGDSLNLSQNFSHREAWAVAFPFLSKNETLRKSITMNVLMFIGLPFSIVLGLCTWIAEVTCRDPQWPQDVIDQTGGAALSDEAVRALISPMPVQDESQLSEDEKNDRSYRAKKGKPWWTPERRKYAVLLALIGMLIGGAKLVQFGIRGY